mmetsp:Transcript_5587/g.20236  ORF Transcript_5587/g.20236 Transcript_5587/m.20236 type:complete len:253 (-) Transcript_5587:1021-1779(-)
MVIMEIVSCRVTGIYYFGIKSTRFLATSTSSDPSFYPPFLPSFLPSRVEDVQRVRRRAREDVLPRVPRHVQRLGREVCRPRSDTRARARRRLLPVGAALRRHALLPQPPQPLRILRHLERVRPAAVRIKRPELVPVRPRREPRAVAREAALKLIEDRVALVQVAELRPQMLVHLERRHRLALHVDVPQFQREVISREKVSTVARKFNVRDARDDLREEAPRPRRLRLVEELTVRVTQRVGPHIREPNRPFTA